jgi:hypothetical protein
MELRVVDARDREAVLPVGERVEDETVDGGFGHRSVSQ